MSELLNDPLPAEFIIVGRGFLTPYFMKILLNVNGWLCHIIRCVIFYSMTLWIYICQALAPSYHKDLAVCFMQQGINLLRSDTGIVFLLVLWFDITHAQTKTHGNTHAFILMSNFTLQSSTMPLLFKSYWLAEVIYLLIWFNKTKFLL